MGIALGQDPPKGLWRPNWYHTLYEAFEKLAQVFGQEQRYRAFKRLHDEVISQVQERLPPKSERPSVAILLVTSNEPDQFYPYPINEGTSYKQWRDLGVTSALKGAGIKDYYVSGGTIDYDDYRAEYGVDSPEELTIEQTNHMLSETDAGQSDIDAETLQDWQTTRRNLAFANAALSVANAERFVDGDSRTTDGSIPV